MARVDAKLSPKLAVLLEASSESGLFRGKSDAARTAIRTYFERNPDTAVEAVRALVTVEDDLVPLTMSDVVRLTGQPPPVFSEEMREILRLNERDGDGGESNGA
jgi:Arc/MetJ-type ribon-helix-helix transcriptional regulator